jgi:hypothetical protein
MPGPLAWQLFLLERNEEPTTSDYVKIGDLQRRIGHDKLALESYENAVTPMLAKIQNAWATSPTYDRKVHVNDASLLYKDSEGGVSMTDLVTALDAAIKCGELSADQEEKTRWRTNARSIMWWLTIVNWDYDSNRNKAEVPVLVDEVKGAYLKFKDISPTDLEDRTVPFAVVTSDILDKVCSHQKDAAGSLKWASAEHVIVPEHSMYRKYWSACASLHLAAALVDNGRIEEGLKIAKNRVYCDQLYNAPHAMHEVLQLNLCAMFEALDRLARKLSLHNRHKDAARYYEEEITVGRNPGLQCRAALLAGNEWIAASDCKAAVTVLSDVAKIPTDLIGQDDHAAAVAALERAKKLMSGGHPKEAESTTAPAMQK